MARAEYLLSFAPDGLLHTAFVGHMLGTVDGPYGHVPFPQMLVDCGLTEGGMDARLDGLLKRAAALPFVHKLDR